MKRAFISLLLGFIAASTVSAQTKTKFAVIEVQCDSISREPMYLTCSRLPLLDFAPLATAEPNDKYQYQFIVVPDPSREYRLMQGSNLIEYGIYLAPGDSLIFYYSPTRSDSLLFDRLGANREFRNSQKPWYRDRQYYHNEDSLDWNSWRAYLDGFCKSLVTRAAKLRQEFPRHIALHELFESQAQEAYYYGLMSYLADNYWDSTGRPVVDDPNRFTILDSIPWTTQPLAHSSALYPLAGMWSNLSRDRWEHAGVDTAGKFYGDIVFSFAHRLPSPAKDVAELIAFNNASYTSTPSELVPKMERELGNYRHLTSDTAYLALFERQLSSLRNRLPGKRVPDFALPDTGGIMRSLATLRGKIIYLDFWGTWCPPCLAELPALNTLEQTFESDTNVAFVDIALEAPDIKSQTPEAWRIFIRKKGLSGMQLYAGHQFQNPTVKSYGIQAVPTFMIINRDGTFINAAAPRPSSGKAAAAIRAALAGKSD